jgi:hypothetical protein
MATFYRVEAPASSSNLVTAGTGKVFSDRRSAEAHRDSLAKSGEAREEDIRIVEISN